jgi:DNA processing protein
VTTNDLLAWNALRTTHGLGPKSLVRIALVLGERGRSASSLLGTSEADLIALGVPRRLVEDATALLASPPPLPAAPSGVTVLCPDDAAYPRHRLAERLPLPVILWAAGNVALLSAPGIAIAGSRSASADILELAGDVAAQVAKAGLNVVSGGAAGVDRAAHEAARQMGTTTVVLAEGLDRDRARPWAVGPDGPVLVVTGFDPGSRWTAPRAMERNSHIAALADAVLIVSAELRGGSWAQGERCLKVGKPLFVLDLPPAVAPGNAALIRMGARAVEPGQLRRLVDEVRRVGTGPTQLGLLA